MSVLAKSQKIIKKTKLNGKNLNIKINFIKNKSDA